YEITEEASEGSDGSRWSHTPELGIFHATTDVTGNIMVSEDRIRYAYEQANGDPSAVYHELSLALGESWDEELEPFRQAADGANVRWLHRVGQNSANDPSYSNGGRLLKRNRPPFSV